VNILRLLDNLLDTVVDHLFKLAVLHLHILQSLLGPPDQLAPGSALYVLLGPTVFAGINFLREGDRPVWSIGRFFLGFNRRGLLIQELAGSSPGASSNWL
jgi:hypothetical protein